MNTSDPFDNNIYQDRDIEASYYTQDSTCPYELAAILMYNQDQMDMQDIPMIEIVPYNAKKHTSINTDTTETSGTQYYYQAFEVYMDKIQDPTTKELVYLKIFGAENDKAMTWEEIAQELGLSVNYVQGKYRTAIKRFREWLLVYEATDHGGIDDFYHIEDAIKKRFALIDSMQQTIEAYENQIRKIPELSKKLVQVIAYHGKTDRMRFTNIYNRKILAISRLSFSRKVNTYKSWIVQANAIARRINKSGISIEINHQAIRDDIHFCLQEGEALKQQYETDIRRWEGIKKISDEEILSLYEEIPERALLSEQQIDGIQHSFDGFTVPEAEEVTADDTTETGDDGPKTTIGEYIRGVLGKRFGRKDEK